MSATTTATVETLTAEVHVLKVGNRQITQSVAKQLNVIPFDRLRPFGRIQVGGPPNRRDDPVDVIGADIVTGALCRSQTRHRSWSHDAHSTPSKRAAIELLNEQDRAAKALPLIVLAGLR